MHGPFRLGVSGQVLATREKAPVGRRAARRDGLDANNRDETARILIAGAVTNICCESSARDAVELDYKVLMISDALSGQAHGLHEATLATFYRIFGDVRPSEDVIRLLR